MCRVFTKFIVFVLNVIFWGRKNPLSLFHIVGDNFSFEQRFFECVPNTCPGYLEDLKCLKVGERYTVNLEHHAHYVNFNKATLEQLRKCLSVEIRQIRYWKSGKWKKSTYVLCSIRCLQSPSRVDTLSLRCDRRCSGQTCRRAACRSRRSRGRSSCRRRPAGSRSPGPGPRPGSSRSRCPGSATWWSGAAGCRCHLQYITQIRLHCR